MITDGHPTLSSSVNLRTCTSLSGDRYEEEPQRIRRGKLDEIEEWDKGNKNIAEEAIGKVKDFINKARGIDDPPDYG